MIVLVTGSRHWDDFELVEITLGGIHLFYEGQPFKVVHGKARGADRCAQQYADKHGAACSSYPALWAEHHPEWCPGEWCMRRYPTGCRGAGPRRNQQMLDVEKVDRVVAFKDGLKSSLNTGGTEDMVRRAKLAKIPVMHVSHGPLLAISEELPLADA
jgi:hypothetical protein